MNFWLSISQMKSLFPIRSDRKERLGDLEHCGACTGRVEEIRGTGGTNDIGLRGMVVPSVFPLSLWWRWSQSTLCTNIYSMHESQSILCTSHPYFSFLYLLLFVLFILISPSSINPLPRSFALVLSLCDRHTGGHLLASPCLFSLLQLNSSSVWLLSLKYAWQRVLE